MKRTYLYDPNANRICFIKRYWVQSWDHTSLTNTSARFMLWLHNIYLFWSCPRDYSCHNIMKESGFTFVNVFSCHRYEGGEVQERQSGTGPRGQAIRPSQESFTAVRRFNKKIMANFCISRRCLHLKASPTFFFYIIMTHYQVSRIWTASSAP